MLATGFERHLNDLLVEKASDHYGVWKHKEHIMNEYNNDRSLSKTTLIFSSPAQADTSSTIYTYHSDLKNGIKKTTVRYDCSRCKSCGNCEHINSVIVNYE